MSDVPAMPCVSPAPKTVEELTTAIEHIFTPIGESKRAFEMVGDQRATMFTYMAGKNTEEWRDPNFDTLDLYFPDTESAVAKTWERMQQLRNDPTCCVGKEEVEDGSPFRFLPARVIWRQRPELLTHSTGICTVRFRAAFI